MAAAAQGPPPVPAAAAALSALGATALFGATHVNPSHTEWLMRGDFALHFLGWHIYRTSPWTLPLGGTPHLIWPVGSSVGLTDSIPLASGLFKLFDPWLPPTFQFIGLWLVTCYALQGLFGALLMRLVTPHAGRQLCGALLFVLSPPLAIRFGHAALAAHWVVLAALWLSLADGADRPSLAARWRLGAAGGGHRHHPAVSAADGRAADAGGFRPAGGGRASTVSAGRSARGRRCRRSLARPVAIGQPDRAVRGRPERGRLRRLLGEPAHLHHADRGQHLALPRAVPLRQPRAIRRLCLPGSRLLLLALGAVAGAIATRWRPAAGTLAGMCRSPSPWWSSPRWRLGPP